MLGTVCKQTINSDLLIHFKIFTERCTNSNLIPAVLHSVTPQLKSLKSKVGLTQKSPQNLVFTNSSNKKQIAF